MRYENLNKARISLLNCTDTTLFLSTDDFMDLVTCRHVSGHRKHCNKSIGNDMESIASWGKTWVIVVRKYYFRIGVQLLRRHQSKIGRAKKATNERTGYNFERSWNWKLTQYEIGESAHMAYIEPTEQKDPR